MCPDRSQQWERSGHYRVDMATCDLCGVTSQRDGDADDDDAEPLPLTWSTAVEGDRRRTNCDRCSREHLRSIESKLDREWW